MIFRILFPEEHIIMHILLYVNIYEVRGEYTVNLDDPIFNYH